MLIRTVVAPLLSTNCYLLSDETGRCVIIDPGCGAATQVRAILAREGLVPAAVLVTHGHADHTWDAAELARDYAIPVHINDADVYRLHDPLGSLGTLGAQLAAMVGLRSGPVAPAQIEAFTCAPDGSTDAAGLRAQHAPGHTQGSTVFLLEGSDGTPVALTGDVLFSGSIGRCDLPGGDEDAMVASLRRLAELDPLTRVLPGHGPPSTIAAELAGNPFLRLTL